MLDLSLNAAAMVGPASLLATLASNVASGFLPRAPLVSSSSDAALNRAFL